MRRDSELLANIKLKKPELDKMFDTFIGDWVGKDLVYRFYHHSFKVFYLKSHIQEAVTLFESIMPGVPLNPMFRKIVDDALSQKFVYSDDPKLDTNRNWEVQTRPVVEAFMHCKYFLEAMVDSAETLEEAPQLLPSDWACVLYLYGMR